MRIIIFFVALFLVILQAFGFKLLDFSKNEHEKNITNTKAEVQPANTPPVKYLPLSSSGKQVLAYLTLNEAISSSDFQNVINATSALIELNSEPDAISDAASFLISNGLTKETVELLVKAIKFYPHELPIYLMLSEALLLLDKEKDALIVLRKFINEHPNNYDAQKELAFTYLKIEQAAQAYALFNGLPKSEQSATVLYYKALALKNLNRLDEAVSLLESALKIEPDFLEILLELAQIEEKKGNYSASRKYYEKVMTLDSYNQDINLRLAGLAIKENKISDAVKIANEATDQFSFVVGVSSNLMEEKKPELVEKFLNALAKVYDDQNNELKYLRGALAYEGFKDYAKALEYFNAIGPNDPHYKKALSLIVQIYVEQDKLENALNTLQTAILAYPEDKSYANLVAQIYIYEEKFSKALPYVEEFLASNPDDADANFQHAVIHSKLGNEDKALELMEKLLKKDPQNYEVLNFIGYTLVERNEKLQYALELIKKAYALQPQAGYISDSLAWAYYRLKNYDEAWVYIQKAVVLMGSNEKQDPALWDHYGDIAFSLGKKEEAKKGWQKALEIKEDNEILNKLNRL